jgi:hypothetical protein
MLWLAVSAIVGWLTAGSLAWRLAQAKSHRDPAREAYIRELRGSLRLIVNMLARLESKVRPLGSEDVMGEAQKLLFRE